MTTAAENAAMLAEARARLRSRRVVVDPNSVSLPCRVVPDHLAGFDRAEAVEKRGEEAARLACSALFSRHEGECASGPEETIPAVNALWRYCADEKPGTSTTPGRYADIGSLIACTPNGSLWAILPAVVSLWTGYRTYQENNLIPPPRKPVPRPCLATVAAEGVLGWWWSLEPTNRYGAALRAGLVPGGPTTPIASLRDWHDEETLYAVMADLAARSCPWTWCRRRAVVSLDVV